MVGSVGIIVGTTSSEEDEPDSAQGQGPSHCIFYKLYNRFSLIALQVTYRFPTFIQRTYPCVSVTILATNYTLTMSLV